LASNLSIIEKGASVTRTTAKTSPSIKLRQIFLQGKTAPSMPACEEQEKSLDMPDKKKTVHLVVRIVSMFIPVKKYFMCFRI